MLRRTTRSENPDSSGFARLGSLTLAALVTVACGDSPGPVSPDAPPGPRLAAATRTPFTAWAPVVLVSFGELPRFTGKAAHFRGDLIQGPLSGDLGDGTVSVIADTDATFTTLKGPIRGAILFELAGGTFEGRFAGIVNLPSPPGLSSGHFNAKGTGAYAGQKMQGTYTNAPDLTNVIYYTGDIVNPNP